MSIENIIIRKKEDNSYVPYYPTNHAQNVLRPEKDISYIDGDTLLEVIQDIANTYISPKGEQWTECNVSSLFINNTSFMCGDGNYVVIFTPYDDEDLHIMYIQYSLDGGRRWYVKEYTNNNSDTKISIILNAVAQIYDSDLYVILCGKSLATSNIVNTYLIKFNNGSYTNQSIRCKILRFSGDRIVLREGGEE